MEATHFPNLIAEGSMLQLRLLLLNIPPFNPLTDFIYSIRCLYIVLCTTYTLKFVYVKKQKQNFFIQISSVMLSCNVRAS